jgi:hypothetical protein
VPASMVESAAREFELDQIEPTAPPPRARTDERQMRETLQSMATLMDRLRPPQ